MPARSASPRRKGSAPALPIPTASERAFEARLAELTAAAEAGTPLAAPPAGIPESGEASEFLDDLFARKEQLVARDPFGGIAERGSFYTKVFGVSFEGRQDVAAGLRAGDELALVRQPENPHDPNAVAVHFGDLQIGYLRKEIAKHLAPQIDAGERYWATITDRTGGTDGRHFGINIEVRRRRVSSVSRSSAVRADSAPADIRRALIGERSFRDPQAAVLERVAAGRNTLAVFGTGRGKSVCYQYPAAERALGRGEKTLVVYPLRALANDQFDALRRRLGPLGLRIFKANGSIDGDERDDLMAALASGEWDVICATPEFVHYHLERFTSARSRPSLFVVDEAHHVVAATHRSAYQELPAAIAALGDPQVIALTATAGSEVFRPLCAALRIDAWVIDPTVRENLHVVDARGTSGKIAYVEDRVRGGGKAIVYCNSRTEAGKIAQQLRDRGLAMVAFYHAGMPGEDRGRVEELFRRGEIDVVVATSAFGEGIDLPDVRNVFLYHLNFDFTEFNQQAGRAGRDGGDAEIHLLFGESDRRINDSIIARDAPSLGTLRELYRGMRGLAREGVLRLTPDDVAATLALDVVTGATVGAALRIFEDAGLVAIGRDDDGRFVRFLDVRERIDLTTNERFAEGIAIRESFDAFCSIVLDAPAPLLEQLVNRPMYPQDVALRR